MEKINNGPNKSRNLCDYDWASILVHIRHFHMRCCSNYLDGNDNSSTLFSFKVWASFDGYKCKIPKADRMRTSFDKY